MADDNTGQTAKQDSDLTIPDEVKAKHSKLIELILASESMNNEERQYWINILPIMTPEQVQNLMDILLNEKKQLEEIDKKYASELSAVDQQKIIQKTQQQRSKRREERLKKERQAEQGEGSKAEELLKKIEDL